MNDSFISVFSGIIFTQGSAVGRETGHACNALNLGCGITINSMRLTAKWEDILKQYEIKKQCALSPGAQCDAQTPEHWLMDYSESDLGSTSYE
jgi:hypothetical protein